MNTQTDLLFDPALIRRFDVNGPRYTSYPTADRFSGDFHEATLKHWLGRREANGISKPLSLYVHIPFCNTICYYCACNKIITKNHQRSAKYLEYLDREIELYDRYLAGSRQVTQIHLGGGTPTFLSHGELRQLMSSIRRRFNLKAQGEYSIEVDPRKVSIETVELMAELGFNRMSIGVQDVNPEVQKAVNRVQSTEETVRVMDTARRCGFKSISIDLIYGLPHQNVISFNQTLEQVIKLSPDRLSIYNYAHLPDLFMPQRRIADADLPSADAKMQILQLSIRKLIQAGYVYIGMDHFAKPDDELAIAQRQGRLHRNFQGYSTQAECDLLAFGISSIGKVGPSYSQNIKNEEEYYACLDRGLLPVLRGIELSPDDLIRRSIIQALMCHFEVSMTAIGIAHLVDFTEYFEDELKDLKMMQSEGLVTIDEEWIVVKPAGRLLVRGIAMVFDRYIRANQVQTRYSKVI